MPRTQVGTGGYDVVVGDLLSTQLLFPALLDAEVESERLTDRVVRPAGCDVRGSVARTRDPVTSERWWTWPFTADLVRGIVARVRH